jgi:hypothetical protein
LVFGFVSVVGLLMGCFTCGMTYLAAIPLAAVGAGCSAFGSGYRRIAGLTLNLLALFPALILFVSASLGNSATQKYRAMQNAIQASAVESPLTVGGASAPQTLPKIEYRELTPSAKFRRRWRAVVVPGGINREQLVQLARQIHASDPASSVRFFTDGSEYEAFRQHDENYPDPQYPSPEDWAATHYIALLNLISDRQGWRWELWAMDGGFWLLPPGATGQTIAVIK